MEEPLDTHHIQQDSNAEHGSSNQLKPGTILFSRYAIQNVIGLGGMGAVYLARDLHFPNVMKLVAVKEMINNAPDPLVRKTIVQNFEREANILVTLSHPSIPKIFDYFTIEDRAYLVEEYINGKDLEVILNESPDYLTEDQVIAWAIEMCDVLHYLHTHKPEPIIFRDIKPSNIMVNQQRHIILIDFGIAKLFKEGQKGTMIGTEGYSPPEQYRGEATPLADIYSLGATLHHLLTRKDPRLEPPFTFGERPIRKSNPNVSLEMETVINTALQYSPEQRFQSADAMKNALMMVARKTGALKRVAIETRSIIAEQSIKPLWTFRCEDEIRSSATFEAGMIYFGTYDNNLYALNASSGEFLWKFPTEGGIVSRPAYFDGSIFFGSEDHRLYAITARGGKLAWTYGTQAEIRCSPAIADGHVFIGSDDGFLHAVNIQIARRAWSVDVGEPIRSIPSIANELIYFGTEGGEVLCVDFRGQLKWRFRAKRAVTSSPLIASGTVYFSSIDSTVYAVDAKSGWAIWRFRMGKGSISSPCRAENYIIIGSADGYIYCLDSGNAREVWRFKTDHQVSGSPVHYKDSVYCGSADGNLYCLEYRTGRLRWKFSTGGPITSSPVIVNDVVYFGSLDHIFYALLA